MQSILNSGIKISRTAGIAISILAILGLVYPEAVAIHTAQAAENEKIIFEAKHQTITEILKEPEGLKYEHILAEDPLVNNLKAYLESKGSPLAEYSGEIVKQPQWQRALAISFVESNFGKRCANNNCSGIGEKPSNPRWERFDTKLDWFKRMSQLLEKPIYKEKYTNCKAMKGVYVVPGSARWVNGCDKVSNELITLTQNSEIERQELVAKHSQLAFAK